MKADKKSDILTIINGAATGAVRKASFMKKLLTVILAAVLLLSAVSCSKKVDDDGNDANGASSSEYTREDTALKSEHFSFSRAEFSYVFYQNFQDFVVNNKDNLNAYGLDTSKNLKDQNYFSGDTWFKYFADATADYMEQLLVFCEAAYENGTELTDSEKEEVDAAVQAYVTYAEDNGYNVDQFFSQYYGSDVDAEVMRTFRSKEALAFKYYNAMLDSYSFTDSDEERFLSENPDSFYYINYISYSFSEGNDRNAEFVADDLSKLSSSEEFYSFVADYQTGKLEKEESDTSALATTYALKNANEFTKWAFENDAQVGDTYISSDSVAGEYTVYMLTSRPALQDYTAKNIRFVTMSVADYGSYGEAYNKANKILDSWKASGNTTAESFGELAYNYSSDADTRYSGGIRENVGKADPTFPEEMINWIFDSSRAEGDTAVIQGNEAYYIVYYSGDGITEWKNEAKNGLTEQKYLNDYNKLAEKFGTERSDEVINSMSA